MGSSAPSVAISVRRLRSNQLDATIAISAILESKRRDVGGQFRFIIRGLYDFALCQTMPTKNPACPSFGHAQLCGDMIHTSTRRARLRSFLSRPPPGSSCPESDRKLHGVDEHSRPPILASVSPDRPLSHRILIVSGNL